MGQTLNDLKKIVDDLARQRDELHLKLHLPKPKYVTSRTDLKPSGKGFEER